MLDFTGAGRSMRLVIAATIVLGTRRLPKIMSLLDIPTTWVKPPRVITSTLLAQPCEDPSDPPCGKNDLHRSAEGPRC